MARAKKVWITQFYERDRKCLCSIARTGLIEKEDFARYNVKDGRVKNYVRDNLIEERYCNKAEKSFYVLTDKGKDFVESNYNVDKCYNFKSYEHDSDVKRMYNQLSDSEQERVRTEIEVRRDVVNAIEELKQSVDEEESARGYELEEMLRNNELSCPDFSYVTDEDYEKHGDKCSILSGTVTMCETITENYKQSTIEAKVALADAFSCSLNLSYTY